MSDADSEQMVRDALQVAEDDIISAREILDSVWSSESDATEVAVSQCILRLRKKIDDAQTTTGESKIRTIKGIGYRFGSD